jgi:single-strand DNA-binding protein
MLNAAVIGNLGNDPELTQGANGTPLLRFNVAANQRVRVDGEWTDRTEWVRCSLFGNRAESLSQHLRKGTKVYVSGRLETRPWTDRNGNVRAGLEITASDVEFTGSRPAEDGHGRPVAAGIATRESAGMDDADLPF